jgi:hypothetical protein
MITDSDIFFFWKENESPNVIRNHMALGFGINGKLVADMVAYVDFYELLVDSDEIIPINEDCSVVNFIKNGVVIETLTTSSFLGSLICSDPDFLPVYIFPNIEQLEKNGRVVPGWLYDENGEFSIPYEGWEDELVDGMYNVDREYNLLEFYTGE